MKKIIALIIALSVIFNMGLTTIYASDELDAQKYTIGNDYILGVPQNRTINAFLADVSAPPGAVVKDENGEKGNNDFVCNGDILSVSGKDYLIKTQELVKNTIFFDDFEDGTKGSWTGTGNPTIVDDPQNGKVMEFVRSGASNSNFEYNRNISVTGAPKTLIHELDFKFPIISKGTLTMVLLNSGTKFLQATRFADGDLNAFKLLSTGGLELMYPDIAADKWYQAKYVMDVVNGYMDIYINDMLCLADWPFQAIEPTPNNYIPVKMSLRGASISQDGVSMAVDNIELYEPMPIKIGEISVMQGETASKLLTQVPVNIDSINVKLIKDSGTQIDKTNITSLISLVDENGICVSSDVEFDEYTDSFSIKPNVILANNKPYTIKINGIKDTVYNTSYTDSYSFTTDNVPVPFAVSSISAEHNGVIYEDLTKIHANTNKIYIQFNVQQGNEIVTDGITDKINLYRGSYKLSTQGHFNAENKIYTMTIGEPIEAGENHTLKIEGLFDVLTQTPFSAEYPVKSVEAWVAAAQDVISSSEYRISADSISGVSYGTDVSEFWSNVNIIPETQAKIYTDDTLTIEKKGILAAGNVVYVNNSAAGIIETYDIQLAGHYIQSNDYTVEEGCILGVINGTSVSEFIEKITVYGVNNYKIYDKENNEKTTGNIENGDYLKLIVDGDNVIYKIITDKIEDTVYFSDDFEDGTKGAWTSGEIYQDQDASRNNVLSWTVSGASKDNLKSYSATRASNVTDTPDILIYETDFRTPISSKALISYYVKNSKAKLLNTVRIDNGNLGTLIPNASQILVENMGNKWYKGKYVLDCVNGKMNVYINDKLIGEGLKFQAPDDFIPREISVSSSSIDTNGMLFAIDNIKLYQPNTIKVSKIELSDGNNITSDLRNVDIYTNEIRVKLSTQEGFLIANEEPQNCVSLLDGQGNEIKAVKSFDAVAQVCTLNLMEVLDEATTYTLVVKDVYDNIYKKNYSENFKLTTESGEAKINSIFLINDDGERIDAFSNQDITAYIELVNKSDVQKEYKVIIVTYDAVTGRIIKCFQENAQIDANTPMHVKFNFNMAEHDNGFKTKIYVRENNGGPVCAPFKVQS